MDPARKGPLGENMMSLGSEASTAGLSKSPLQSLPVAGRAIRVLFVEDDDNYREVVADELGTLGFTVQAFPDGPALLSAMEAAVEADVIVLDWSLPTTSGIDLLPQLRRRGVNLPVVFLTGRAFTDNESLAFDRGAIDFIDKARGVEILARRLRNAVETGHKQADPQ